MKSHGDLGTNTCVPYRIDTEIKGSKSIINRFLCMSLYHNIGISICNINLCDDVIEMLEILKVIGKHFEIKDDTLEICHEKPFTLLMNEYTMGIKNAGTVLRFILPYLAFAEYKTVIITLGDRLSKRPIVQLIDCLNRAGANISFENDVIIIRKHRYIKNVFVAEGNETSQFISSLMMFGTSRNVVTKIVIPDFQNVVSKSYIKMTESILYKFNIEIKYIDNEIYIMPTDLKLTDKLNIICDPDYSTACYYFMYSYLMQKEIYIKKITDLHQPDYYFIDVLKKYNINFIETDDSISVDVDNIGDFPDDTSIDMGDMPDQIITLAFMAFINNKKIYINGCHTLNLKESNRLEGISENIKRLGGSSFITENSITIFPLNSEPKKCILTTFDDHRFAMTFMVLKQKYTYLEIDNIDCVRKSFI